MQPVSSSSDGPPSSSPSDPAPPSYASLASPLLPASEPHSSTAFSAPPGPSTSFAETPADAGHPAFQHHHSRLNLPSGFFLLRNRAQGKALDLLGHKTHEGAAFGVHPVKQPQLKGLSLQHNGNNQLFFLDWDGRLTAAGASRAVEVVDGQLSLAYPHPVMTIPSSLSHPLPRFRLDPTTSTLHVLFSSDPFFRGPSAPDDWKTEDYIVEVVPRRRKAAEAPIWGTKAPNQLLSDFGQKAGGVLGGIGEKFGGIFGRSAPSSPALGFTPEQELPLPPPPVPEKAVSPPSSPQPAASTSSAPFAAPPAAPSSAPRRSAAADEDVTSDSDDSDSDPSAFRPVRIVRLPPHWRDKFPSSALSAPPSTSFSVHSWPASAKELRLWRRRQWEVVPVTVQPVPLRKGEHLIPSPVGSSRESDEDYSVGSDGESEEGEFANEEGEEDYSNAPRIDSPPLAGATREQPILSTLSSAATSAQSHASSAATALGGIISGAFSRRGDAEDEEEDGEAPLPALPSEAEGKEEWDDAPVLQNEEIEGLTATLPAEREVKWGEAAEAAKGEEVREPVVVGEAVGQEERQGGALRKLEEGAKEGKVEK